MVEQTTLNPQRGEIVTSVEPDLVFLEARNAYLTAQDALAKANQALTASQLVEANASNAASQATTAIALATAAQTTADQAIASQVSVTGATMTGPLYLSVATPSAPLEAAPKQYVDSSVGAAVTDGINAVAATKLDTATYNDDKTTFTNNLTSLSSRVTTAETDITAIKSTNNTQDTAILAATNAANAAQSTADTASAAAASANANANDRVLKTGDTMSGTLNLPVDGLKIGSAQLVMVSNRLGLGTPNPQLPYDIHGGTASNVIDLGSGSAIDCTLGNYFIKTIGGATTFTFTNPPATANSIRRSYLFILRLTAGGSFAITWPTIRWSSGIAPILSPTANDFLVFVTDDGGTTWFGNLVISGA